MLGPVGPEPVIHRRLIAEVEMVAAGGEEIVEASLPQPADDGRAHQAAVASEGGGDLAGDAVGGGRSFDSHLSHGWKNPFRRPGRSS